ncbi:MAG: integrase catalytic domain-containing protein [Paludibacteraceae bacterium]|nr:integrase catalytic domain-containing protein [Paludibacteraceae bacterium]
MEFNNSYIERIFKVIKQFIKWAKENYGYNGNADTYRIRKKNVTNNPIVYLNWDELQNLYNSTITSIYLQHVRDVFCFCCFTSLRYSDVAKLQRSDITESQITIVTKKTSESITIELNSYSKSILDKYKDIQFKNNLALPIISNQKMNIYLKQLAKENGLCTNIKRVYYTGNKRHEKTYQKWELITTHCGRRTFIVNALFLGIPAEVVMKWTGHADYTAMRPYIHIVDELKSREMEKFNRR